MYKNKKLKYIAIVIMIIVFYSFIQNYCYAENNNIRDKIKVGYFSGYPYEYQILIFVIICLLCIVTFMLIHYNRKLKKISKQEMKLSDKRINIALEQTKMFVWEYDISSKRIIRTNGNKENMALGDKIKNAPESLIESGYIYSESAEEFLKMFDKILKGAKTASGLFKVAKIENDKQSTDKYIWIEIKITNIFDKNKKPIRAIGLEVDVTEKVNEELKLKDKASKDDLTNLLNRTSFQAFVLEFLEKEYQKELISALIIIDIDDFKKANDRYGHLYGDEVLKGIASKMTNFFRMGDLLGRLGGDEFVVFIKNVKSYEVIEDKAKQICESLVFEKEDLVTTCSVGIAIVPNRYVEYDALYKAADESMYEAKRSGKGAYVIEGIDEIE